MWSTATAKSSDSTVATRRRSAPPGELAQRGQGNSVSTAKGSRQHGRESFSAPRGSRSARRERTRPGCRPAGAGTPCLARRLAARDTLRSCRLQSPLLSGPYPRYTRKKLPPLRGLFRCGPAKRGGSGQFRLQLQPTAAAAVAPICCCCGPAEDSAQSRLGGKSLLLLAPVPDLLEPGLSVCGISSKQGLPALARAHFPGSRAFP